MITRSKTSELRRIEAKRQRSEHRVSRWRQAVAAIHPLQIVIWSVFFVAIAAILLTGGESLPYSLNQKIEQDIHARVPFEMEDQARIRQERQVARASAPTIYTANPAPIEAIQSKLTGLLTLSKAADPKELDAFAKERKITLSKETVKALREYATDDASKQYDAMVSKLVDKLNHEYIVARAKSALREQPPRTSILQRDSERVEITTTTLQFNTNHEYVRRRADELSGEIFPKNLRGAVSDIIFYSLTPPSKNDDPTDYALWRYDQAATAKEIDEAQQKVPAYTTTYKSRELLVEKGTVLGSNELILLAQEHEQYVKAQKTDPELRRSLLLRKIGLVGLVLILTLGLATYSMSYQTRLLRNSSRAIGLACLCLLMLLLARLNERVEGSWNSPPEFAVGCIVMAAILLVIAYNQRFAFGVCGVLALLVTIASRSDLWLFVTLMAACGVATFALREVRTRGKIIAVGTFAGLAAFITSMFGHLYNGQEWLFVLTHAAAAFAASLGAGFIAQGILHYFERIFGIATSLTLLEWCDAGQPLLRKLANEAPGTYSHSLILSQMADEAASAINANGLLARVGALYHDIGKTQKPQYFVENQEARMNRHDRLSPTMSLLIILGHVKDGIEMARAYGLPRVLHQFIAEHHGTTIVKYFHHAASEKAARDNRIRGRHDQVSESEFRYPGPKPRSKESAILMICDSCEGAVRALPEPTPGRIETLTHQIIMEKLNDGQFDNCDITLRELNLVEKSLIKSLCAIHHGRIKYPGKPAASEAPKPATEAKSAVEEAQQPLASNEPATANDADSSPIDKPPTETTQVPGSTVPKPEVAHQT